MLTFTPSQDPSSLDLWSVLVFYVLPGVISICSAIIFAKALKKEGFVRSLLVIISVLLVGFAIFFRTSQSPSIDTYADWWWGLPLVFTWIGIRTSPTRDTKS